MKPKVEDTIRALKCIVGIADKKCNCESCYFKNDFCRIAAIISAIEFLDNVKETAGE